MPPSPAKSASLTKEEIIRILGSGDLLSEGALPPEADMLLITHREPVTVSGLVGSVTHTQGLMRAKALLGERYAAINVRFDAAQAFLDSHEDCITLFEADPYRSEPVFLNHAFSVADLLKAAGLSWAQALSHLQK